nr:cobalamin biosynthesis protein [Saccharopolyspora sp. HNM0983]
MFAVTAAGRRAAADLAIRVGPEAMVVDGPLAPALRRVWDRLDAAVFFLGSEAVLRLVAPLLQDVHTDPGVVCVDEAQRFAIALTGGPARRGHALAEQVADALGCTPVVTTAGDSTGSTPLDELVGVLDATADGDPAECGTAVLDGLPVRLENPLGFPLPALPGNVGTDVPDPMWTIVIDDGVARDRPDERVLRLIPRTLVVGIGSMRGVSRTAVTEAVAALERRYGLDPRAIRSLASVDRKADERGILEAAQDLGFWHSRDGGEELPLLTYPADALAAVDVPHPSETVRDAAGTPSVAEAAALRGAQEIAAGGPVELAVPKIKGDQVTVAAARVRPRGRLAIVGVGPGDGELRTPRAEAELRRASIVVGPDRCLEQVRHLLRPGTELRSGGPAAEQLAAEAVRLARGGNAVALIGSGDAGVYAVAGPALERAGADIEYVGVPGITAALSAAALLGAPLGQDHALISLSDRHTPWEVIERRVRAAAEGDLAVCFYDPRSRQHDWQLPRALQILAEHRPATTPVGAVRRASRDGPRVWCAPIGEFDAAEVDACTTVLVGSSQSSVIGGRMVTPGGYRWMAAE